MKTAQRWASHQPRPAAGDERVQPPFPAFGTVRSRAPSCWGCPRLGFLHHPRVAGVAACCGATCGICRLLRVRRARPDALEVSLALRVEYEARESPPFVRGLFFATRCWRAPGGVFRIAPRARGTSPGRSFSLGLQSGEDVSSGFLRAVQFARCVVGSRRL